MEIIKKEIKTERTKLHTKASAAVKKKKYGEGGQA